MDSGMPPSFGDVLREHRTAAGLTQEDLAERTGLSREAISALERGTRGRPQRYTVRKLADTLRLAEADRVQLLAAARGQRGKDTRISVAQPTLPTQRPPLVGRRHELALLERHLGRAGPPVLLLAGAPGIGKTRMLHEAADRARGAGLRVLESGCQRRGGQDPYAPLLGALKGAIQQQRRGQLRAALRGCAWLVRLLPELADGPIEPLPAWTVPPAQERRLMLEAVARFLGNVAGPAGTLLVLDDLQWAGPDALDLLMALARSAGDIPLRLFGAYRDTEVQPRDPFAATLADLAQAELGTHLTLGPLAPPEATELLDALLAGAAAPPPALRERVLRRAGGAPFFLVSCARAVRAGVLAGGAADAVPWDVSEGIRQRVAALPEGAQELLGVAAVVGRRVSRLLLTGLAARPEVDVLAALRAACRARLLEEEGEEHYQFAHDVIREVVEADLGAAGRAALHRRVAEALERGPGELPVEALAYHYGRSGEREKAVVYLERAGDRAQAQHANAAAEGYYRELVERLDGLGRALDGARAREKLGAILCTAGQYTGALAVFEQAAATLRASGDLAGMGRVVALIGRAHAWRGTLEEGVARLAPLLGPLGARGPSHGLAAVHSALARLYYWQGQFREALAAGTRAAEMARLIGDAGLLAEAEVARGWTLVLMGPDEEALRLFHEGNRLAEAVGDLDGVCMALLYTAFIYEDRGEFATGRAYAARALALAERLANPIRVAEATLRLGALTFFTGDWIQARACFERLLALPDRTPLFHAAPLLECGRLALAEGAWDQASGYLEECSALARDLGYAPRTVLQRTAESLLAERDLLEGRAAAAVARLLPLLDRDGMEERTVTTYVLSALAWAYLERGDVDQARRTIGDALRRARAAGYRLSLVGALRVQALIALRQGDRRAAECALDEGLSLARPMPYPHGEGRLLEVYGRLHLACGERAAAPARLEAALAVFRLLGARKDAERTEHLLAALD